MALAKPASDSSHYFSPDKSVLLVTEDGFDIEPIRQILADKGYKPVVASFTGSKLKDVPRHAPNAILTCFSSPSDRLRVIIETLRIRFGDKNVPVIGIFSEDRDGNTEFFDSVLFGLVHPAQVAHRVNAMIRLNIMQTEIALRMETLRDDFEINYNLNDNVFMDRLRVLFVGKATLEFMVIINALEKKDVEVVAAFTSFSAFDFLHDSTFDAVVMNALNDSEPALSITQTMRRNSALYHTPSLLLTRPDYEDEDVAYKHGVSDIIHADAPEKIIQDRILELANFHRLHRQVKSAFDDFSDQSCRDESGAYSAAFFAKHLDRLVKTYSAQDLPVSVITVHASFDIDSSMDLVASRRSYNQLGQMIKNMVRVYDVTARLSHNIFVIAFPGQPASSLAPVIKRLSGISKAAEFGPNEAGDKTYKASLIIDIVELGHGVTGESWLAQQALED